MNNSPLVRYTGISPNRTSPRNHAIDTITIHCVVGQLSAESICGCFAKYDAKHGASCNYGIGTDGRVSLCVEEKDRSWCSSSRGNDNRAVTIECACDRTHPYVINDNVYQSLILLCADICKRNKIKALRWKADKRLIGQPDKQNLTVHRWFANKACPGDYIYSRLGQIAAEVNALLNGSQEEEKIDMTKDETLALVKEAIEADRRKGQYVTLADVPLCYRPSIEKLLESGVMSGYGGGKDGALATFGDNDILVDETFCRIITVLNRVGALDGLSSGSEQ